MAHLNFLVLLLRPFFPPETRVLVRQNGTVSSLLALQKNPGITRLLYRRLYPRADRVICQSPAMAKDLTQELEIAEARLAVLPNPVDVDGIRNAAGEYLWNGPGPHLLAVGRLSREKGFDVLLRALLAVRERFPHADLTIAGAGPEERALKAQCRKLGLEAAVRFAGYIERPSAYFPGATAFVLHPGMKACLMPCWKQPPVGYPLLLLPHPRAWWIYCVVNPAPGWRQKSPPPRLRSVCSRRSKYSSPVNGLNTDLLRSSESTAQSKVMKT
jgi:glycosyltransferase involved in cell wall biosynthesis